MVEFGGIHYSSSNRNPTYIMGSFRKKILQQYENSSFFNYLTFVRFAENSFPFNISQFRFLKSIRILICVLNFNNIILPRQYITYIYLALHDISC